MKSFFVIASVLLICCVADSVGEVNLNKCKKLSKEEWNERKTCVFAVIANSLYNSTVESKTSSSCKSLKDYEDMSMRSIAKLYNPSGPCNYSEFKVLFEDSRKVRFQVLEHVMENDTLKKFFDDHGLDCIKKVGNDILNKCINHVIGGDPQLIRVHMVDIIARSNFLSFSTRARDQGFLIMNCTRDIMKSCSNSSAELITSLSEKLVSLKNFTETFNGVHNNDIKSSSTTMTVMIVLLALVLVSGVSYLIWKKVQSKKQSEAYDVDFQQRADTTNKI